MNLNSRKIVLEVYGLIRIVLGVAQIVGLMSAFFLLEFIVKYPKSALVFVIDENLIVLTYLAVLLRGLFHLIAGIGIVRCRRWVNAWLYLGWVIVGIITYGMVYSLGSKWVEAGFTTSVSDAISPIKLFVYIVVALFDFTFIAGSIRFLEEEYFGYHEKGKRFDGKLVFGVCFLTLLFFSLLFYLGKPISKGFHKGYYKSSGVEASSKRKLPKKRVSIKSQRIKGTMPKKLAKSKSSNSDLLEKSFYQAKKESASVLNIGEESSSDVYGKTVSNQTKKAKQVVTSEKEYPYNSMVGYAGSFCLTLAFLLQAFSVSGLKTTNKQTIISFVFFCIGFLFLFVYGLSLKLAPIAILSLISFIICVGIICLKIKYYE